MLYQVGAHTKPGLTRLADSQASICSTTRIASVRTPRPRSRVFPRRRAFNEFAIDCAALGARPPRRDYREWEKRDLCRPFSTAAWEFKPDPALAHYTDVADGPDPSPATLVQNLIASRSRAIIVVGNCPPGPAPASLRRMSRT